MNQENTVLSKSIASSNFTMTIDHVAIAVKDVEEGIRWYCENLGFQLLERRVTKGEHTSMRSAVVKSGAAVVVLIQGDSPDSQVSRFIENFGPGVQHLAFAVDDLDAALDQLGGGDPGIAGAPEIDPIDGEGIRQVFLRRDPGSGVRIELIERKGGQFNDKSVEKLFRAFEEKQLF